MRGVQAAGQALRLVDLDFRELPRSLTETKKMSVVFLFHVLTS